jgi:hypothetical protein
MASQHLPTHVQTQVTRFEQFCLNFQTGLHKFGKFMTGLQKKLKIYKNISKNPNLFTECKQPKIRKFKMRKNALNLCSQLLCSLIVPVLTKHTQWSENMKIIYSNIEIASPMQDR